MHLIRTHMGMRDVKTDLAAGAGVLVAASLSGRTRRAWHASGGGEPDLWPARAGDVVGVMELRKRNIYDRDTSHN